MLLLYHNCFSRAFEPHQRSLMNSAGIDTSALLTMLGLIAAVWAIVPSTARLSFRLSLNWFDWLVIWVVLLIIHDTWVSHLGAMAMGF